MIDRWFGNDGDVQSGDQDINTLTSLVVFIYNHNSHAHTHTLKQLIVTQHSYRSATSASVKTVVMVVRGRDRCPDDDLWTL